MVSFTAAKTSLIFDVSVACVRLFKLAGGVSDPGELLTEDIG
jgi:hypothetical protein